MKENCGGPEPLEIVRYEAIGGSVLGMNLCTAFLHHTRVSNSSHCPLAHWASRRRQDLLEVLDRINPTIAEPTEAIEQEVEKCPDAQRLMTHPRVGALTAIAFVLIIREVERFGCSDADWDTSANRATPCYAFW